MEQKIKRDDKYIQFPLCFLQGIYKDPQEALNIMLDYGIVKYGKSFKCDLTEVARQLMYAYYRNRGMIQDNLYDMFDGFLQDGLITEEEDHDGFYGPDFNPEDSIQDLLKLFASNQDFKEAAIFQYQIKQAADFLKIKIGNIDSMIRNYTNGFIIKERFEKSFGPDCCPGIKTTQIIDFRDSVKDLDLFQAYVGIKSLIGQKNFVSTHKSVIRSRMLGCKSNDSLHAFLKVNKVASDVYKKYEGRKRFDNLLFKLMERGFIIMISKKHESRIYISAKIKSPLELAEAVLKSRKQTDLKKQIAEASKLL